MTPWRCPLFQLTVINGSLLFVHDSCFTCEENEGGTHRRIQTASRKKELEATAREAYKPSTDELMERVSSYAADATEKSLGTIHTTFTSALNQLSDALHAEVQKFNELRQAIEVSKQRLAFHYHIEVAAGLVEKMIADYEERKRELENDISSREREWSRQCEEQEYQARRERNRARELFEDEQRRKEQELLYWPK